MASDDVIELGSSDEDTEPAPKKRKPLPNAMVLIPEKRNKIMITSGKSSQKINPACIVKGTIGEAVTVTKIPKTNVNPYSLPQKPIFANTKINGKQVKAAEQSHVNQNVQTPLQKKNVTIPIGGIPVANSPVIYKTGINLKGLPSNAKGNNLSVTGVNPLNNMVKVMKPNVRPVKFSDNVKTALGPKVPKSVKNLSILPPGITVKRTGAMQIGAGGKNIRRMPHTVVKMSKPSVITTVDLDDEEPDTASASGPQWYLRPEDRTESQQKAPIELSHTLGHGSKDDLKDEKEQAIKPKQNTSSAKSPKKSLCMTEKLQSVPEPDLEKQNNKEPDRSNFVEITIEDSPLKPAPNKKGFKVGAELAITIEDSPVKTTADIPTSSCQSGDEETVSPKYPHSKKKLEYSKETLHKVETIEIEFEPLPSEEEPSKEDSESDNNQTNTPSCTDTNTKEKSKSENIKTDDITKITENKIERSKAVIQCSEIVEIEDSPIKALEKVQAITPKKNNPPNEAQIIETVVIDDKEKDEFHPMYQNFINLCFRLENSDDMKKIVEKKIKSYYRQVPKEYTESEAFIDMVSSKIMAMKASPEKMYLYIKDVVDELNLQRKIIKMHPPPKDTENEEQEKFLYGKDSEFDSKRQRQIRKLEKTLKKLHRAIQKLEEQEVDFDDEEDSVYLLTDRYKERMVRVHAKLCQLTNTKMPSEARVHIDARPGQPKGPAKRLDKWINRKVPIGTPLPFPDFHDVLRCVRDANQEDKLGWNEADIMEEARDLFTRCGKKLQRRRQENEWRLAASRIPTDVPDPAEDSNELKKKLEDNKRMAAKRETEVLNKYADRQNQLNLEAVEIEDKEAEESPVESDDEESVEDNASLTSTERRKERIKRLLQEKSKKVSNEKENQSEKPLVVVGNSQKEDVIETDPNKAVLCTKKFAEKEDEKHKNEDSTESKLPNKDSQKSDLPEKVNLNCKNKDDNETQSDKVHSLSDDSNKVESDIDELHLLQKLYSENELNTSVMDSSDSGTPIAISDSSTTEVSNDEREPKKLASDVISIENSSYSESEEKKGTALKDTETDTVLSKEVIKETVEADMEIEYSNDGVDKKNKENKKEKRKSLEDILLASSDEGEDTKTCKINQPTTSGLHRETSINLRDDSISIGETVIEESRKSDNVSEDELKTDHFDKNTNTDASSVEGMEIGPEVQVEEQNGLERNIVDTESIKSTDEGSVTEITSIKSTEEENAIETNSVKSVETIEDGNSNESTSIKSVEAIEDANANETDVKSVETIEDGNGNESTSIKSVEAIEDANANETSVKSVESIEDGNGNESTSIKSVETVEDANANETSIKSVETIEDGNDNESTSIKSVETIEDDMHHNELSVQSDETIECANVNESTTFKTITITEDTNSDDIEDVNANEMTSSNSVESIEDAIGIEPKLNIKSVEALEDANINKVSSIKSIENIDDVDKDVNETSAELFQEVILTESIEYSQKHNVSPMDTSDNVDATMKKARQYNDSLPEPMEVDSNAEHT